jgi:hypothetical protein
VLCTSHCSQQQPSQRRRRRVVPREVHDDASSLIHVVVVVVVVVDVGPKLRSYAYIQTHPPRLTSSGACDNSIWSRTSVMISTAYTDQSTATSPSPSPSTKLTQQQQQHTDIDILFGRALDKRTTPLISKGLTFFGGYLSIESQICFVANQNAWNRISAMSIQQLVVQILCVV